MKKIILLIVSLLTVASYSTFAQKKGTQKNYETYLVSKAKEEYDKGNINNALELINAELQSDQTNCYAHYLASLCLIQLNDLSGSLSSINKCLENIDKKDNSRQAKAHAWRGHLYTIMGDTAKAMTDLSKSISITPTQEAYYERTNIYLNQGKHSLAQADAEKTIEIDPADSDNYSSLAKCLYNQDNLDEAVKYINYAIRLNENNDEHFLTRAIFYKKQKKYTEAARDILTAMVVSTQQSPRFFPILTDAAQSFLPQLEKEFKRMIYIASSENKYLFQYYLAEAYRSADLYEKAIPYYSEVFKTRPHSSILGRMASCFDQIGLYDKALDVTEQFLQQVKEENPDDDNYEKWYANLKVSILDDAGRSKEAIEVLNNYIEKYSDDASLFYRRAWIRQYEGDLKGAIDDFSQSIALDPEGQPHSLLTRGNLRRLTGDEEGAREDFETLIEISTDDNEDTNVMFAYHYLGNNDKARSILSSSLKQDPSKGNFYNAACLESLIDNKELAVAYMDSAFSKGYIDFAHINRDRDLDNIRETEEFKNLVASYKDKFDKKSSQKGLMFIAQDTKSSDSEMVVEIPFTKDGNMCKVKCTINGLPLHFIFDTGASDVSISSVEASFMIKNDFLQRSDIRGAQNYMNASGEISTGTIINLREVKLNDVLSLTDIRASVAHNQSAPLLLGQSVLERLGKIEIDNEKRVLRITYTPKSK
ncbi:MAG: retroviral-like aspartic protease family protein [Bacteroidales bacterium]|nr:retroviral-like aspartic protease family protein [Bacteroidales bacterium]